MTFAKQSPGSISTHEADYDHSALIALLSAINSDQPLSAFGIFIGTTEPTLKTFAEWKASRTGYWSWTDLTNEASGSSLIAQSLTGAGTIGNAVLVLAGGTLVVGDLTGEGTIGNAVIELAGGDLVAANLTGAGTIGNVILVSGDELNLEVQAMTGAGTIENVVLTLAGGSFVADSMAGGGTIENAVIVLAGGSLEAAALTGTGTIGNVVIEEAVASTLVAARAYARIATTLDAGVTWTDYALPTPAGINWLCHGVGGGKIVLFGDVLDGEGDRTHSLAYTSDDRGATWTASSNIGFNLKDMVWDGTKFHAINSLYYYHSTDGLTWTQGTITPGANFNSIVWTGTNLCVSLGSASASYNYVLTSPDGVTWTQRTLPYSLKWGDLFARGNDLIVVSFSTTATTEAVAVSHDGGLTWAETTGVTEGANSLMVVATNGTVYIVMDNVTAAQLSTDNGATVTASSYVSITKDITVVGSTFLRAGQVNAGSGTGNLARSTDGVTWTETTIGSHIFTQIKADLNA